jgi:hypothetical protein
MPGQGAAVRPPPGRWSCRARAGHVQVLHAPSAAQHVVRREGGTRVLGRSRSRSRGENGSEDLPVRFGATAAHWCGVGGQVAAVVGAEVVVAREGFSADETVGATCGRTPGSLALMACPRPSCGDVGKGLLAAAFALRSSLLLFSPPRRRSLSRCWCSGRRRATWSLLSRRTSGVGVVHTRGSGTGVPFVMAP